MSTTGISSVPVPLAEHSYRVSIAHNVLDLKQLCAEHVGRATRTVVVVDETVANLHLDRLRSLLPGNALVLPVAPGEASKSLATAERLYTALARSRIERSAVLVTFGGGVVGDLGGFVAATWQRGIRFIQIPTTLLAAVDAAVGGKTALNLAAGKNLVGVFHQPAGVLVATEFLATLPPREFGSGLAESVKHALIRDAEFLRWHEAHVAALRDPGSALLVELIARNVAHKAAVVSHDEREAGPRALLNYGHTLGHAFEHLSGYELLHGECVALGMVAENEIARRRGLLSRGDCARVRGLLGELGLPVRLPRELPSDDVLTTCRGDKKVRGTALHLALLKGIGTAAIAADVSEDEIRAGLSVVQPGP